MSRRFPTTNKERLVDGGPAPMRASYPVPSPTELIRGGGNQAARNNPGERIRGTIHTAPSPAGQIRGSKSVVPNANTLRRSSTKKVPSTVSARKDH